jgi:hypothetical protein
MPGAPTTANGPRAAASQILENGYSRTKSVQFPKKLAAQLRELKIEDVLRKMAKEDSDEEVQRNATIALENLGRGNEERKKN